MKTGDVGLVVGVGVDEVDVDLSKEGASAAQISREHIHLALHPSG